MAVIGDALAGTVAIITAMGALGTAAMGLVDASKAFGGGVSNFGLGYVVKALAPFTSALQAANGEWAATVRANWINGVAKDDQKSAAKTLIRLGLSDANVDELAKAGGTDAAALKAALDKVRQGLALTTQDAEVFGRFNAVIDAAMDAGFERGDQLYRNVSKLASGLVAIGLALWAGYLMPATATLPLGIHPGGAYWGSGLFWWSLLVGVLAVPIAPIAKDLASSLQTAASAIAGKTP